MIHHGDSLHELRKMAENSIDTIITDPPYGYSFMGKDWDKAVPSVEIWQECLRVLKPGAFACVMSAPRSDVQQAMTERLIRAGFRLDFTPIYWTYASGFPKAGNVSKLVDKRGGVLLGREFCELIKKRRLELGLSKTQLAALGGFHGAVNHGGSVSNWEEGKGSPTLEQYNKLLEVLQLEGESLSPGDREVISRQSMTFGVGGASERLGSEKVVSLAATDAAKALDGSYTGFQPKPAVEVIIVAMKPLSEKTYVDQALKNGKGITWLDDCRVPTGDQIPETSNQNIRNNAYTADNAERERDTIYRQHDAGRFPANLLVSDEALNGHSKYFDLDAWADTLPFLAVPKASKSEKNKGLEHLPVKTNQEHDKRTGQNNSTVRPDGSERTPVKHTNHHPTVKPLKLMSYLITLFSREGDTVLDPFVGSGTTAVAAQQLNRIGIGIEREAEYAEIARARLAHVTPQLPPEKPEAAEPPVTVENLTELEQMRLI